MREPRTHVSAMAKNVAVVFRILIAIGTGTLMSFQPACEASIDTAEWTEEVRLHDGQMIQVWREARAEGGGLLQKRGSDIDFELRYPPMNVRWKNVVKTDGWVDPVSFEIFDGIPHLVVLLKQRALCAPKSPNDYAAKFFKWQQGNWVEVAQSDFPVDVASVNLYRNYWGFDASGDARGLVTWKQKAISDGYAYTTAAGLEIRPDSVKRFFESRQYFCGRI